MEKSRKQKILIIFVLMVSTVSLSIGFAMFSSALNLSSSASITPNSDTFSVRFSTEKDSLKVTDVVPSDKSVDIYATNGIINNLASPVISNLSATFTSPGQFVEYKFFARNEGEYTAYLNNINFIGEKTCAAEGNATEELVNAACDDIEMFVILGDATYDETTEIYNHALIKKTGEQVIIRLEYNSGGDYVDGEFMVDFSQVTMTYSTINDSK